MSRRFQEKGKDSERKGGTRSKGGGRGRKRASSNKQIQCIKLYRCHSRGGFLVGHFLQGTGAGGNDRGGGSGGGGGGGKRHTSSVVGSKLRGFRDPRKPNDDEQRLAERLGSSPMR